MYKLKPCPFCGGEAEMKSTRNCFGDYAAHVECTICGVRTLNNMCNSTLTLAAIAAAETWNERVAE